MNRNVTILIVVLTILVIAGYLVWLRNQFSQEVAVSATPTPMMSVPTPTITPLPLVSSSSAIITPSMRVKEVSPSAVKVIPQVKISPKS